MRPLKFRHFVVSVSLLTIGSIIATRHILSLENDFDEEGQCPQLELDQNVIANLKTPGVFMQPTSHERPLAIFNLQPWRVEETIKRGICEVTTGNQSWGMLFVAKSALQNVNRRDAIRSTWGSVKIFDGVTLEVAFILGATVNSKLQSSIEDESKLHGDIIQYNKNDNAGFVPEKVIAGMQWSYQNLPDNWIYASTDDDVVINPANLIGYFRQLVNTFTTPQGLICFRNLPMSCIYNYQANDPPSRNPASKWYMPPESYPGPVWPVYCRGGLYATSRRMIADLFLVSRWTRRLYLDDVWITGFMRRMLGQGDYNIVAAPMSVMSEKETYKDHDIRLLLVKHLWGNIENIKVDVPVEMEVVWKKLKPHIIDMITCEK